MDCPSAPPLCARQTTRISKWLVLAALVTVSAACSAESRKQKYLESGNRYMEQEKYREAMLEFRQAVAIDPKFTTAHARLAEVYARLGDTAGALGEYVRAADLLPEDSAIQLTTGRFLLAAGRFDEALARAEGIIARNPQDVRAHVLRGNALGGLNDLPESLAAIEEAIRLDPARGSTYTQLGMVELAQGKQEEAGAAFRKAVEIDPKWLGGYLALANHLWNAGKTAEAERALQRAVELDPQNEIANRALAALATAGGRMGEAEGYLKVIASDLDRPGGAMALADHYLRAGRPRDAVEQLETLIARHDLPAARLELARSLAASGDRARALTALDALLAADAHNADAMLEKGLLLLDDRRRSEALALLTQAVEINPSSAPIHFALGRAHAARGDRGAAMDAFKETLRLNPRAAAAQTELSKLALADGRGGDSIKSAGQAVRDDSGSLDAKVALIRSLLATRDLAAAQRELDGVARAHADVPAVQVQLGVLAAQRGDSRGARTAFERARKSDANNLEALAGLLSLDVTSGDKVAARQRIQHQLETSDRPSPQLLVLAARTFGNLGDPAEAERLLHRALEADDDFLPAYNMLGQLYLAQQKLQPALDEFDALAKRQSRPTFALTMAGMILQAQGDIPGARNRFERALLADSAAAVAANNLAWILVENGGDLDTALRLAQQAVRARPDAPEMMDTLGWTYIKKQRSDEAIALLLRCIDKAPANPVYHYHLGIAQLQAGRADDGRRSLERALAAGAPDSVAAEIRKSLQTQSN